jgi:hypothetical protein
MSIAARTCDLPSLLTPSTALRAPASDDARALAVSPAVPTGLGPPSSSADLICASKRSQLRNPCSGMPHAKRVQLAQQAVCTPDRIQNLRRLAPVTHESLFRANYIPSTIHASASQNCFCDGGFWTLSAKRMLEVDKPRAPLQSGSICRSPLLAKCGNMTCTLHVLWKGRLHLLRNKKMRSKMRQNCAVEH